MEKQELKEKLKEQVKVLKTQCKDAKFAKSLIDEILSLKGQLDVKADERVVVSEIKQSAYSITKFENDDIEVHFNGYTVNIKPWLKLHQFPLDCLLNLHDNYDKLTEEDKENYDDMLQQVIIIMQMPTIVFNTPELLYTTLNAYVPELNNLMEQALDEDNLPKDDQVANEEFRKEEEIKEEITKELGNVENQ